MENNIHMCTQGSPEWFDVKRGKVSASKVTCILRDKKGNYKAARADYMMQLLCERLTGNTEPTFPSADMKWGIDNEPFARSAYEAKMGLWVTEVGFIEHPAIKNFGMSPDGLTDDGGLIEIKCPKTKNHLLYLDGLIPKDYKIQMSTQMTCSKRKWCDFVSYDPRLPDELSLSIHRYNYDGILVREIELEVPGFLAELDALEMKWRERMAKEK